MLTSVIAEHSAKVQAQVAQACIKFDRNPKDITILAVSKTHSAAAIRAVAATGLHAFGENYLQEALLKQKELTDIPTLEWHFIGAVQSNKTRELATNFTWLHTLEREKIATRLNAQRPEHLGRMQVLIQVNVSGEASKAGVAPADVFSLAQQVVQLPNLELRGLMCIPLATDDFALQRQAFEQLRHLRNQLQHKLPDARLDTLSMGMSADLEAAIAEGSTLVRIGSAIFGARS